MTQSKLDKTGFKKEQELLRLKHLNKELKSENLRLHKKLARCEAKQVTLTNRVKELKKIKSKAKPKEKPPTLIEMARTIMFAAEELGISAEEFIKKHEKS